MANADVVKQFAGKMVGIYTGAVLTKLIDLGCQVGLFNAANAGPASSDELAERAGLKERYVREWLGAMVTGGIFTYDPSNRSYTLPEEHAVMLCGDGPSNVAPLSRMVNHLGTHIPRLAGCFRSGGGIPYSAYRPVFTQCMDDVWRRIYDHQLISGFIPAVDGLEAALNAGIRVLDIGCGTGHAINIMAREFPKSRFVGFDIAYDAISAAREEARNWNLSNATFEMQDVANLPSEPTFDLVTAFDAIHDQKAPDAVLRGVRGCLAQGGSFMMIEFKFSSRVEDNVANPFAPMYYGISLMHCMPVSLAVDGQGLGTVWGEQLARDYLAAAGFGQVQTFDSPRPQNRIFVAKA